MPISGRHAMAATMLSSLLALQVASPAPATASVGFDASGAFTVPVFPHRAIALPAPAERVKLLYHLPLRNRAELERLTILQGTPGSQAYQQWLTPAQFQARYAPDAASVATAVQALRGAGLSVDRVGHQLLYVSAPVATIEKNFATHLEVARDATGRFITARDSYRLPPALARVNGTLLGLIGQPRPRPYFQLTGRRAPQNRYSPVGGYFFDDLKQAYDYPTYAEGDGRGRHIAIVGDSDFNESDAFNYFAHEGLGNFGAALEPAPVLTHTNFPGSNLWSADSGFSLEANLDVQQSGGSAPGAEIDGYSNDYSYYEGFLATYAQIVESNAADIVSTSYGGCELAFTPAYNGGINATGVLMAYHEIFLEGNSYGITFIFSSGDDAGKGCYPPGYFQVHASPVTYPAIAGAQYWANDPAVTAVGGTNLTTTYTKGSLNSAYVSEQAIADYPRATQDPYGTGNELSGLLFGSGGGESVIWDRPDFQTPAHVNNIRGKGRLSPDISMHMGGCPGDVLASASCLKTLDDPGGDSFDYVGFDGLFYGVIGTSAAAPEFAGLLAVYEQLDKKRRGNINPLLYTYLVPPVVHQGIPAFNGIAADTVKKGQLGYNLITGLGTPVAIPVLRKLTGKKDLTPAGIPQTLLNP